ncbi:MAG TPA: prepilin-type N-terminal cleavage/methylation domain-containing protein [Candidatus Saccharimonadales bacterium]|nr:prepilin-type N-terminal cleavage/methylation domain-containing protein [Candidatus Saccharimonadales bacterium]
MKGQTLVELLLGISIVGIILSGITVVVVSSLGNASYGKNQSLATQYAQEGAEITRTIRNSDYNGFAGYNSTYCLDKGAVSLGSPGTCTTPNIDNTFIRSVKIENTASAGRCAANVSRATVIVSWKDGQCSTGSYCHKSQIISCLSTVNPIQAP